MPRTCLLSLAALVGSLLSSVAHARIEGDAIAGKPFGVARVTFTSTDAGGPIDESQVLLDEREGRVHYPAVTGAGLGRALGQTPQFWLNLQTSYDLKMASLSLKDSLRLVRALKVA